MTCILVGAEKQGNEPKHVKTLTVQELKNILERYRPETKVYLSFNGGACFGGVSAITLSEWS